MRNCRSPAPADPMLASSVAWLAATLALFAMWTLGVRSAAAIDAVQLAFDRMEGEAWHAEQVDVRLSWIAPTAAVLSVSVERIELPEAGGTLTGLELTCPHAEFVGDTVQCEAGTLRAHSDLLDAVDTRLSFRYRHRDKQTTFTVRGLAFAGGTLAVSGSVVPGRWAAQLEAGGVDATRLATVLAAVTDWPEGLSTSGTISAHADLSGTEGTLREVTATGRLARLGFMSADGLNAGEDLDVGVELAARDPAGSEAWRLEARVDVRNGTLCLETCWALPEQSVQLATMATWDSPARQLRVDDLRFEHPGVTRGHARLQLSLAESAQLRTLSLRLDDSSLAGLYATWLQPLLLGTMLDAMEAEGTVAGNLDYRADGESAARLRLENVSLDDQAQRFGVFGMHGELAWSSSQAPSESTLRWDGGHLYRIALGRSELVFHAHDRSLILREKATLPVLDGALRIERFRLDYVDQPRWEFDGILTPVSMPAVSEALGWPTLSGTLSGVIPDVTYANDVLAVGGVLLVRAFDGDITVRGLQLERLFGVVPTLRADIDIKNLDLDTLTRTFSFGNIQGRLSGRIHQLLLQAWEPVAFDASFATPADDRSRHRISQKAVDNISSLGGAGMGGVVSRGFLRVFEDFSYERLGISCRLHNNVCDMGGVAPAPNGYYLVKGGGLPRIEVLGYADRVDWGVLVERLMRVTADTAPMVQ